MGLWAGGCVRAEVAVVSQHTALERQAAGEYVERERSLDDAAIQPGPEAIPREDLVHSGEGGDLGVVAQLIARAESDEERLDILAAALCVGEGLNGLLVATSERCRADVDPDDLGRLVSRANLHRRQAWEFLAQRADRSVDEARAAWREVHLERVVCGALVEESPDRWEPKECAR